MRWPSFFSSRPRAITLGLLGGCVVVAACGWNPDRPFEREAPQVNAALGALDGGDARGAATTLEDYLSTGACSEGSIGAPELVRKRPNGTFDLGLSLFKIGESYGRRFGDEEVNGSASGQGPQQKGPDDEKLKAERGSQIACALRVVGAIAADESVPLELRARARYLEGNLNFLDGQYEEAVTAYDKALTLAPGEADGGDLTGRDAAFNRAIALKRIEDKKDAGHDGAPPDSGGDGGGSDGGDSGQDSGSEAGGDSGGGGKPDSAGQDSGSPDSGASSPESGPPPPQPDAGAPPPPTASQDDRILDQLENAPTVQQEAAKKAATRHQRRGMADK